MFRKFLMGTVSHIPFANIELNMSHVAEFERTLEHVKFIGKTVSLHNELVLRGEL